MALLRQYHLPKEAACPSPLQISTAPADWLLWYPRPRDAAAAYPAAAVQQRLEAAREGACLWAGAAAPDQDHLAGVPDQEVEVAVPHRDMAAVVPDQDLEAVVAALPLGRCCVALHRAMVVASRQHHMLGLH